MNKRLIYMLLSFLFFQSVIAQNEKDSLFIQFGVQFNGQPLQLSKKYCSKNNDTIAISSMKWYVSNITIEYTDQTIFKQPNSFHLLDIEKNASLRFSVTKRNEKTISKVIFSIGIDSTASTSGALAGQLDPTNGMYWAWQSGYINWKLEGTSKSCKTRKNQFQFHVGGYKQPYYAMRTIEWIPKNSDLMIVMDVADFFANIALSEVNSIMVPGKKAMELADLFVKMVKTE